MKPNFYYLYNKFILWSSECPGLIDVWMGDCHIEDDYEITYLTLTCWNKWLSKRKKEDYFFKENAKYHDKIKQLIDEDAITEAINILLKEAQLYEIMRIRHIVSDYPEINNFYDLAKLKYDNLVKILTDEVICRFNYIKNCYKHKSAYQFIKRNFDYDISSDIDNGLVNSKYIVSAMTPSFIEYLTEKIRPAINKVISTLSWFENNHKTEFRNWSIEHNIFSQYSGHLKYGYAALYQKVWWRKYLNIKYWDYYKNFRIKHANYREDQITINSYEAMRRLSLIKLNIIFIAVR